VGVGVAVAVVMVGGAALGARNRRCDDRQSEKGGESIGKYLHGDLQWLQRVSHSWRLKVQNRPSRPFLKVSFGSRRQDPLPSGREVGGVALERLGGAVLTLARMHAGIEAANPTPLIDVDRASDTARDRANLHVAANGAFGIAAARELGHAASDRGPASLAIARGRGIAAAATQSEGPP
jgi:hypothetical protein